MREKVIIRSNRYGLEVHLNPTIPFEELLLEVQHKFEEAGKFFQGTPLAASFEDRNISREEEEQLIEVISSTAGVDIVCVIDNDSRSEQFYRSVLKQSQEDQDKRDGQFYRGTLSRRQVLESQSSIIILGDVERGAKVISNGNVVVMGSLKGRIHAGAMGDKDAFIVALHMRPERMKIADIEAKHIQTDKDLMSEEPKIAIVDGEHIYIDPLIS